MKTTHKDLMTMFCAGIRRVGGREAVYHFLAENQPPPPHYLVAVGKASTMAEGALAYYGDAIQSGIVISKVGHIGQTLSDDKRLQCIESDHPVPTQRSLDAGAALVEYVSVHADESARFLFLLSGGASSLVEVLPTGLDLDGLRALNLALLSSGFGY